MAHSRGMMSWAALIAAAGLLPACGSKDDGTGDGPIGSEECDPNGDISCFEGKAEPCEDFHTDYRGDEYCLKPPDDGMQLHVGPENYDDPAEVEKWILPPGGFPGEGPDTNWCYYMKAKNPELVYTAEYFSRMRPGSHHFIMFAQGGDLEDSVEPDKTCSARNASVASGTANFLAGATRAVQNATMFGDAPEDQGLGSEMQANQQLNMNLHFVNITDEPVLEELWVNMIYKPADEVTEYVKAITWYGGLGMEIPPNEHTTLESSECVPPKDVRILGVTAHAHANTVRVSTFRQASPDAEKQLVFSDYDWEEPTVWLFNSVHENTPVDDATKTSGTGLNGILDTTPEEVWTWECEVVNKSGVTLTFSDKAYSGEMCNVFGMYAAPVATAPWSCSSL